MQADLFSENGHEESGVGKGPVYARLSDFLTFREITIYVTDTAFHRGKSYQRQGRVRNLEISDDLRTITAKVRGSAPEPYQQVIILTPNPGQRTRISGTCTCPLGYNCKHVAAVLIEALEREPRKPGSPPATQSASLPAARSVTPAPPSVLSPLAPPLPYDLAAWLDQLTQTATGESYPPDIPQRLIYVIKEVSPYTSVPHLGVDVISSRVLKNGSFSSSTARPVLSNYYLGNWPRYFRSSDVEICQILLVNRSGFNPSVYPVKSLALLKSILETGRAYWQSHSGRRLTLGEPRAGQIGWIMPDVKGMRPTLKVEDAIALNSEPPVYVDVAHGAAGEILLPIAPQIAYRLLSAPAIAPALVEQVSQSLVRHFPQAPELAPKAPEPPTVIDDGPTPMLHLMLAKEMVQTYYRVPLTDMPVARLTFRYGPVEVDLKDVNPLVETIIANRRYQVKRRPTREKQALSKLTDLHLRSAREIHVYIAPKYHQDFAFLEPLDWLDFLSHDAPELEAQGFEIRVDDDFPYRLAKMSGELDTEVFEGTGMDWFELGMGVQVDGERLDLGPLLADLVLNERLDPKSVSASAQDGDDLFIKLKDGRHLALAAKRFLPLIVALHELTVGGAVIGKSGRLQVSRAETALLSTIEDQTGLVFKGAENLRSLARRLQSIGSAGLAAVTLPETFRATLRPYQAHGVTWLNLLRDVGLGGILADDMGLGKTVQILALLALEKAQGRLENPALIIAPTSLMTNWQNEARRFAPELNVLLLHGAARKERFDEIAKHDIVLTTYPLIARDQAVLLGQNWHMAILDEAQTIKNPNAATTRLIRDLKSAHRFCLTGTPMENHLGELWSLMTFVNPGYLGDKTGFARRWRTPIEKHADAERSRILSRRVKPFMLRRTKQEVARELPPKTEITESIVLDDQQRDVYDSIRLSMHKKVRDAIAAKGFAKSHIIILEALLKLRQVCCDPRLLKISGDKAAPPSAKLERLMEMVQELLSEGRKIIVFSQFTSMLHLITLRFQAANISFSLLTGDTTDRKSAIENFQLGKVSTFLVSLKAGGVGLNLTAADTVILYDPWWNPAVEEQAIDRAYRIGQDKPVFVYRLVAEKTIEEKMDELKAKKRALADSIFDQTGNPTAALTEEDLNNLFDV
jgi:superfamily II DNA or RNA helicase